MSEASYQLNVVRGVTGSWSGTCLMAAYDRISSVTGITTQTYERYDELRELFVTTVGDDANFTPEDITQQYTDIKADFRRQLGVYSDKNVVEDRVDSEPELRSTLAKLAVGGYRTAVYLDIEGLHAVGVTQLDENTYEVKSTWTPFPEDEPVAVKDLFEYLDRAPRQRKKANSSRKTEAAWNIVALPAEPTGSKPPYTCL